METVQRQTQEVPLTLTPAPTALVAAAARIAQLEALVGELLAERVQLRALFLMCDESWAMGLADARRRAATGKSPSFSLPYYLGSSVGLYLTWVSCTTVGVVIGPTLGDVHAYGFDMAFTAVFLVLLKGMWRGAHAARPWLVSLVVAALTYLLVPGAWYVAAGALTGVLAAFMFAEP